jgi:hypothetical protein
MDLLKAVEVLNVKIVSGHVHTEGILVIETFLPYVIPNSVFIIFLFAEWL